MATQPGKVSVIGSGVIGRHWAMLFAGAQYSVCMYDVTKSQLEAATIDIKRRLEELEADGILRGTLSAADQMKLIRCSDSLEECVKDAIHVQECVPDVLKIKQKVFGQLDELCAPDTVISSSSSTMPASMYTETLTHRARCIVSHPVNPPYLMRLVELVPTPWTDPEVVKRTRDLMTSIGQAPITLNKEVLGFVQPRIQYALLQECLRLVADDVVSADGVDNIMTEGLGMRYSFMGPFETIHLNADGVDSYNERYSAMIYGMTSDSGPIIHPKDDPRMGTVFKQLNQITPLEKLDEKRKWRDENIARLAKLKINMDKTDGDAK